MTYIYDDGEEDPLPGPDTRPGQEEELAAQGNTSATGDVPAAEAPKAEGRGMTMKVNVNHVATVSEKDSTLPKKVENYHFPPLALLKAAPERPALDRNEQVENKEKIRQTLLDFGIRAIIAPSFADIFSNNALGNGLVLVKLAEEEVDELFRILEADPGMKVTVDLVTMTCTAGERTWRFTLDPFRRKCLLEGLDAVSLTLEHEDDIRAREKREPTWLVPHVEDLKSCPV